MRETTGFLVDRSASARRSRSDASCALSLSSLAAQASKWSSSPSAASSTSTLRHYAVPPRHQASLAATAFLATAMSAKRSKNGIAIPRIAVTISGTSVASGVLPV